MQIKFVSINPQARTATFNVDGVDVTRKIPAKFDGTIDDYLNALANGLAIEVQEREASAQEIETPAMQVNEVVVDVSEEAGDV